MQETAIGWTHDPDLQRRFEEKHDCIEVHDVERSEAAEFLVGGEL